MMKCNIVLKLVQQFMVRKDKQANSSKEQMECIQIMLKFMERKVEEIQTESGGIPEDNV